MKRWMALWMVLALALLGCFGAIAEDAAQTETAQATDEAQPEAEAAEDAAQEEAAPEEEAASEEEASEKPAVSPIIKKLTEVPWYTWAILACLVVAAIVLIAAGQRTSWNSRRIAMGAMCIAIGFVLSCIRLYRMPQGGSVTPAAMLPLIMFMVACGPLQGFVVGCAFGLLQLITDPWVIHPVQLLVDYPLAYGAMILGCLVALMPLKDRWKLPVAVLLASLGRYAMAVLSGVVFFADSAGDQNALVYSLIYNVSYLGPDALACLLVACIPGMDRLTRMIAKEQ